MSARKLQLNLFLLYAGELAAKVLALVAVGHLGHTLGDEGYGPLVLPLGIYFVFNQLLDAGLAPFGAREASKHPSRTRTLAARISWLRLILVVGALALLALIAAVLPRPDDVRLLTLLYGAALLPMPFIVNWAFEARGEMSVVAGSSFLRQVVFCSGVVATVREPQDLLLVPLFEAAGIAAQAGLQQSFFRRRVGAFLPLRGVRGASRVLRESLPLGASTIFSALRWFTPLLLLAATASEERAAHLESGHKIVVALHVFVWLYFVNLLPAFSRLAGTGDVDGWRRLASTSLGLVAWVGTASLLVGHALAPLVLEGIYGPTFGPGIASLQVLGWMLLAAFVSGHHRYTLIAHRRPRPEMVASLGGFLVSAAAAVALLALGRLAPVEAAGAIVAGEVATLVLASVFVSGAVGRLPVLGSLAPPLAVGGAVALVWGLGGIEAPWARSAIAVVAFGSALALLRPAFLAGARSATSAPAGK